METLFNSSAKNEILGRINNLKPGTKGLWGKMDSAQMLAHCGNVMEVAIADKKATRAFSGRFIGPFIKKFLYNEVPFPRNSPTDKNFKIDDSRDFDAEKDRLVSLIDRFQELGPDRLPRHKHPYFGSLTNIQWGKASYKHLSYHLGQFGV